MAEITKESPVELNAQLNLWSADGKVQFESDKEAAKQFFLQEVNETTRFHYSLEEKLNFLFDNKYYEREVWDQYDFADVKALYKFVYGKKHRFESYFSAFKYDKQYGMKSFDGKTRLERFEDRVVANALLLGRGNVDDAYAIANEIIEGRLQPATPTFSNAGKAQRGEFVSCFLLRLEDNMESIGRAINSSLQLSKRGGGVALLLSNLREMSAPIKHIEGQSSGIIPVMKLLEDSFSYANQLGNRQGAGAVYLNAHHPDISKFLDTKRENADEKIRIKTLSLGVVVPDITYELAKNNEEMYLFSPYDVQRVYGKPFADISVTEKYREMVEDDRIKKTKFEGGARAFLQTTAELLFESGYPYILFEDNANRAHANGHLGRINMSNLCTEILQANTPSEFAEDLSYDTLGRDISCNLASLNIAKTMEGGNLERTVRTAIRALSAVSDLSEINSVPSVREGNDKSRAIGLGQMNLHGFFIKHGWKYGSQESLDFTNAYFMTVAYHAYKASMELAKETRSPFDGFEKSKYADPGYLTEKYNRNDTMVFTTETQELFRSYGIYIPTTRDWAELAKEIAEHGLYNAYLQAIPPTGSISYVNYSTSSIHPVAQAVETRKEGLTGRVYFPQPYVTNENFHEVEDAYQVGPERTIDVYAEATKHVDQGLSLTLFFPDTATTRDINKAQMYAWRKGIKTLYYSRVRQSDLAGTELEGCVSCAL
ncbi:ribonucleotide reductase [Arthrobacter phage Racecar]|nr:ribonucleotide reductase [Arthrobacter phage Racecar]QFG12866.1 ribonucleotide reductase [Arthrobacter phage Mimi]